jgi:hypothetical protein
MSMVAILGATKQTIQAMLGLTPGVDSADIICDITPQGMPKSNSGQVFYGIVGSSASNSQDLSIDETYRCFVVITLRAGLAPLDRNGNAVLMALKNGVNTGGLWARAEELRAGPATGGLHMNGAVIDLAGGTTGSHTWTGGQPYSIPSTENGFVHPWAYESMEYLGEKGPDWFSCEDRSEVSGVAVKVNFHLAQRVQTIESGE